MAAATAEDWFCSTVKPDASLAEYITAAPRGMTNPPNNPKVREALLKDIKELGMALESKVWPPPARRHRPRDDSDRGVDSIELLKRLRMPKSPSCPAVFGGTSLSSRELAKALVLAPLPKAQLPGGKAQGPKAKAKSGGKGTVAGGGRKVQFSETAPVSTASDRKRWIYSAELDGHIDEFEVTLSKGDVNRVGVTTYGGMILANPELGSLLELWNRENPEQIVNDGDRIVEVNGVRDNFKKMIKTMRKAEVLDVKVVPGWNRTTDAKGQSHGCPTALWRTKRAFYLEDEGIRILGTAPMDAPKPLKLTGSSADETWTTPQQQKLAARVPTDAELRNARFALKGQSSLHLSASADIFRYCADVSKGAPLCIKGAGVPSGLPGDVWASDGAALTMFHNKALRLVNPSALMPNKEEVDVPRRKKKTAEDDLKLSDSGMFKHRYPIDESLKSLRRFKRELFPDDTKQREEQAKTDFLKTLMGGGPDKDKVGSGGFNLGLGLGRFADARQSALTAAAAAADFAAAA